MFCVRVSRTAHDNAGIAIQRSLDCVEVLYRNLFRGSSRYRTASAILRQGVTHAVRGHVSVRNAQCDERGNDNVGSSHIGACDGPVLRPAGPRPLREVGCRLLCAQGGVVVFEVEDAGDARDVYSGVDECRDPCYTGQVVGAVAPGASGAAMRAQQAAPFPQSDGLNCRAGQLGGDRYGVHRVLRCRVGGGVKVGHRFIEAPVRVGGENFYQGVAHVRAARYNKFMPLGIH